MKCSKEFPARLAHIFGYSDNNLFSLKVIHSASKLQGGRNNLQEVEGGTQT